MNEAIQVFLRIRPTASPNAVEYTIDEGGSLKGTKRYGKSSSIKFQAPDEFIERHTYIPSYRFGFDDIFDQPTEQRDLYLEVGRPVVERALEGFNGTIFAYGQTATGKTHTILGAPGDDLEERIAQARLFQERDARTRDLENIEETVEEDRKLPSIENLNEETKDEEEKEEENEEASINEIQSTKVTEETSPFDGFEEYLGPESGIIPRILADVFAYLSKQQGQKSVQISYLEIYNNEGFDLLSERLRSKTPRNVKDLSRVFAMTDARNKVHLKNLSLHEVRSMEHSFELLNQGNATRKIAETQLNEASSRSHCIFTIYITTKNPTKAEVTRSKINLVDLAGSERVSKWANVNKILLKETRNINLSLHHLQRVIEALSHKQLGKPPQKSQHVPFRSSLITLVLSDSLGGNSVTRMVATVSNELPNLDESISTCRFAQRVASIKNRIYANHTTDSDFLIARLKQEIEDLRRNLQESSNSRPDSCIDKQQQTTPVPPVAVVRFDEELLEKMIAEYLQAIDESTVLDVEAKNEAVQYCYRRLKKQIFLERQAVKTPTAPQKSKLCIIL